jgi:DNA ligase-4
MMIIAAFVDIVHSSNGTTQRAADDNSLENDNTKRSRTTKKGEKKKKSASIIPSHLMKTDVSGLKGETLIFANMIFCILS